MDSEITDAVTGWETVSVEPGYAGLHEVADGELSGAVAADRTWAFVLNGRFVDVFGGDVEDFEDKDLRAYRAPEPVLSLLYAMRERGGETRAKYYTNDTPLTEVDETLSASNFTGYVVLSENVLSGDYYVVYSGGKSMSAAFVGSSRRLLAGDEAFERANDEVGIYEVREVGLDLVEIPEPEGSASGFGGRSAPAETETSDPDGAATESEAADGTSVDSEGPADAGPTSDAGGATKEATPRANRDDARTGRADTPSEAEASDVPGPTADDADDADDPITVDDADGAAGDPEADDGADGTGETADDADAAAEDQDAVVVDFPDAPGDTPEPDGEPSGAEATATDAGGGAVAQRVEPESAAQRSEDGQRDVFSKEAKWREAKSIPALDPEESAHESTADSDDGSARTRRRQPESRGTEGRSQSAADRLKALKKKLEAVAEERERLEAEGEALREERDELEAERDELKAERDELTARVNELEAERDELAEHAERLATRRDELEAGREAGGSAVEGPAERTMTPSEALSDTNLFVRYADKGDPTLEAAHAGRAEPAAVNDNLRLEHHTMFETEGLTVDDRPFEEFLEGTLEYRFVEWVVRDLLYEVQNSDNRQPLQGLYDAVPEVDRVEFHAAVQVGSDDEESTAREFDVVLWDGMGNPLLVADLNPERNAATKGMVATVVDGARDVGDGNDTLGAAFVVTSSYFKPEALDLAAEKTGGGLLSRSKRKAFVKLSRKRGFHLCLVEARNDEFYVTLPDL